MTYGERIFAIAPMMDWTDLEKKFVKTITKGFSVRGVVPSLYCSAGIADFHGVVG